MEKGENPKIKIMVCCHKPGKWLNDDIYMPIQCGKALSDVDLGIQGDDTGDNISAKNPSYCELTAMYWAWKNLKDIDYIGLCHYRRYFDFKYSGLNCVNNVSCLPYYMKNIPLNVIDFCKKERAAVVVKPHTFFCNMKCWYAICHNSNDMKVLRNVLEKKYPNYLSAFDKMLSSNKMIAYNMFICKKNIFDDYCEWLFDILFELERYLFVNNEDNYQKRVFGFLSERLMTVYAIHNRMDLKRVPVLFLSNLKNESSFKYVLRTSIDNIIALILSIRLKAI